MVGDPLNPAPLRLLALGAEVQGDVARAEELMELAKKRSKRNARVQAWLAKRDLEKNDLNRAVENLDALVRVLPAAAEQVLPVLKMAVKIDGGRYALASVLRKDPPWRERYVNELARDFDDPSDLYRFFADLMTGPAPLRPRELRAYLDALIGKGEPQFAYALWLETLPKDRLLTLANVSDGDFDYESDGSPFDWGLGRVTGARTEVVTKVDGDRSLKIEFFGARVAYRHVSQTLLLGPGNYRLSGERRAENLQNERGLQWTITCTGGEKRQLGETPLIRGTLPWGEFSAEFSVPEDDECRAQTLLLSLAARVATEQKVAGEVWFDKLRIEKAKSGARG